MTARDDRIDRERARRWWQTKRRIGSIERAADFIDDVGFALLFPRAGLAVPSLWEAVSDRQVSSLPKEWGPDLGKVWEWKDELPARRRAWYGRFLFGRPSFLSREMLKILYPRAGRPDDFRDDGSLGADARRIAEVLLSSGAMPSAILRSAVGLDGKAGNARYSKAVTALARSLVVTHAGVEELDVGWPSALLDLTARRFRVGKRPRDAAEQAAALYLGTVVSARPGELARAFGVTTDEARARLETLAEQGSAVREGSAYRAAVLY